MQQIAAPHRKALVVEEQAADRDLGISILSQLGYQVEAVATLPDALARLAQAPFSLLLLSSSLPDMRPETIAELQRSGEPAPSIVVVHAESDTTRQGDSDAGVIGHASRPISTETIKRLVEAFPRAHTPEEPVVDMEHLLSFTDGDMELEGELSALFLSSAEAYYEQMSRSLQERAGWTSSAHALKGASANLGARRLAALARTAEHQPPDADDLAAIRHAIDEVSAFLGERQRTGGNSTQH